MTTTDPATIHDEDEEDGPPVMGVVILLCAFMSGMALGAYLEWLR